MQFIKTGKEYRHLISKRKREVFQNTADLLAQSNNVSRFQKIVSSMRKRVNGSMCELDPNDMNLHCKHFENTFGGEPCGKINFDLRVLPNSNESVHSEWVWVNMEDMNVVHKLICECNKGTAPGPDELNMELLLYGMDYILQTFTFLLKVCDKWNVIPSIWCKRSVCLIYKNKGDVKNASNYQPISLICIPRRIYEKFIMKKHKSLFESILENEQGGFREKCNTCASSLCA